jgi:uncharacterized membrane protein YraQ (UPF0718 family)
MLAAGAPITPVMVFLMSSPLISPSAFFVTLGGLGMSFAVWRLVSAGVLGLAAGWLTDFLLTRSYLDSSVLRVESTSPAEDRVAASCDGPMDHSPKRRITKGSVMTFLRQLKRSAIFIGKFVLLAVVAQAFIVRYMPQDWVTVVVGAKHSYSVLLSTLIGIPAYVNSFSAVPLLRGLLELGMDKGAALAFFISGPVMSVPSMLAVVALFKRRILYVYIAVGFLGALLFGYAYTWVLWIG